MTTHPKSEYTPSKEERNAVIAKWAKFLQEASVLIDGNQCRAQYRVAFNSSGDITHIDRIIKRDGYPAHWRGIWNCYTCNKQMSPLIAGIMRCATDKFYEEGVRGLATL